MPDHPEETGVMIEVPMTSPYGVILATKGTYCPEDVQVIPELQSKTVSPSTSAQDVTSDSGKVGLSSVHVNAMPSGSVSNPTAIKGTVSNNQISIMPSVNSTTGYITGGTKNGTAVTVQASELVSGTLSISSNGEQTVTNYQKVNVNVQPSLQDKSVSPSTSSQKVSADSGYYGLNEVTVAAMPSGSVNNPTASKGTVSNHQISVTPSVTSTTGYITGGTKTGTPVTVSASELVSGNKALSSGTSAQSNIDVTNYATVSVSAIASGTAGTPTATKSAVSGNSITVTPSVTNTTGYITGGTKTGAAVTVKASDLVSGSLSISANGTHTVTNYNSVTVNVQPNLQSKSVTPSESSQTVSPDAGYNGLASVSVGAISTTYVGSGVTRKPAATYTPTESAQTIAANQYLNGAQTIAAISSTYIGSGVTRKNAETITPGTSNKTIAAGQYLNGAQTIAGDANLVASNIISGKTIFGVAGNVQINRYYAGSSAPSSSLGNNGDIYFRG